MATVEKIRADRRSLNRIMVKLAIFIVIWIASVLLGANVLEAIRAGRMPGF